MAHFYGWVKGRGYTAASRTGTKQSGLVVRAMSKQAELEVSLHYDPTSGEDVATVTVLERVPSAPTMNFPKFLARIIMSGPHIGPWRPRMKAKQIKPIVANVSGPLTVEDLAVSTDPYETPILRLGKEVSQNDESPRRPPSEDWAALLAHEGDPSEAE